MKWVIFNSFLFINTIFPTIILGDTLKLLSEIISANKGAQTTLYGLIRCSALHYASTAKMMSDPKAKELVEGGKKMADQFNYAANKVSKDLNIKMSKEQILENITNIIEEYDKTWKKNYAKTGQDWGEITFEDLKVCSVLHAAITG